MHAKVLQKVALLQGRLCTVLCCNVMYCNIILQVGLCTPASATPTTGWASSTPSWRTATPTPACPRWILSAISPWILSTISVPSTASPPASRWRWPSCSARPWPPSPGTVTSILWTLTSLRHYWLPSARTNTSSSALGTAVHLDCPTGAQLSGDSDILCRDDGESA